MWHEMHMFSLVTCKRTSTLLLSIIITGWDTNSTHLVKLALPRCARRGAIGSLYSCHNVRRGLDFVRTDGVYLVAGWLDHLATPTNVDNTILASAGMWGKKKKKCTHAGMCNIFWAKTGKRTIPFIWMRADNAPSLCWERMEINEGWRSERERERL